MFRHRTRTDPKTAALRTVEILRGLSDRELAELARHVEEVHIPARSALMEQGTTGHEAYLVVNGTADVLIDGDVVGTVSSGDLVGEMALIDRESRSASVVAVTQMKVLAISQRDFGAFVERPEVAAAVARVLVGRLRAADLRQHAHWTPA